MLSSSPSRRLGPVRKRSQSTSDIVSFCNLRNPWFLLIVFVLLYAIGFILFLPSVSIQNNELMMNTSTMDEVPEGKQVQLIQRIDLTEPMIIDNNGESERASIENKDVNNETEVDEVQLIQPIDLTEPIKPVIVESNVKIESWRIVENNDSFLINNDDNLKGEFIPLNNKWGTKYLTRVLCLIPTLWPDRKQKMEIIAATWATGCTKLMWVVDEESNPPSSYAGFDTLVIPLTRKQNNEKHIRNIWEKVNRMWTKIYQTPSLFYNYEWFIKADDDTFIATENLFGFLQYYDSSFPHYIGHSIRSRWSSENVVFNSGICYVLSRETIRRIGRYLQHLPTLGTKQGQSHCIDRDGAGEDPTTGICLLGVGIRPQNTLDHNLRERFLIFRDTDHQKIYREDTWFWKLKPPGVGEGMDCCSPFLISMHNYKMVRDARHFFPLLMEKYNKAKDFDKIIMPPKPRWFLYDKKQIDFEIDEYLNINNPPKGQRIYKGPGKEWQCHKCDIGNINDLYWTEWWDNQSSHSQHVNDAYSPLKI